MHTTHSEAEDMDAKPTYEFDARFSAEGRVSPLCGVKLWLPIDCHENARIQVVSSGPGPSLLNEKRIGPQRLVSEIDPNFGFEIEADALHLGGINTKIGLKVQGADIKIDHIGRLRLKRRLGPGTAVDGNPDDVCTSIIFRLSSLNYGSPHAFPVADYRGNRKVKILSVRTLNMRFTRSVVRLELHRHWNWHTGNFGRLIAGSFPVLEVKRSTSFRWGQLKQIQDLGRDACLLLTLAARHLTVVHVFTATTKSHLLEEWIYPLNRQRSSTEEKAMGPLVDENKLQDYFSAASVQWAELSEPQRDAVRLAIFSIHPFAQSSIEGHFLQMFTALEGLAKAWHPDLRKIHKKIEALVTTFPPRVFGLWPIVANSGDGLDAIRNQLAHGGDLSGKKHEILSVGIEHLQVWMEKILLSILHFSSSDSPLDWLSRCVQAQRSELPSLRTALKLFAMPRE